MKQVCGIAVKTVYIHVLSFIDYRGWFPFKCPVIELHFLFSVSTNLKESVSDSLHNILQICTMIPYNVIDVSN